MKKAGGAIPVIALESFTDASGAWHHYGHEFTMADTAERAALVEKGIVRIDDRVGLNKRSEASGSGASDAE